MINEIGRQNFNEEVLQSETPVMLDFFAHWCIPCRMLSAVLDDINEKYGGVIKICRVDVENETKLAIEYGIRGIPTVIFFKDGMPAERFTGFRHAEDVEAMVTRMI